MFLPRSPVPPRSNSSTPPPRPPHRRPCWGLCRLTTVHKPGPPELVSKTHSDRAPFTFFTFPGRFPLPHFPLSFPRDIRFRKDLSEPTQFRRNKTRSETQLSTGRLHVSLGEENKTERVVKAARLATSFLAALLRRQRVAARRRAQRRSLAHGRRRSLAHGWRRSLAHCRRRSLAHGWRRSLAHGWGFDPLGLPRRLAHATNVYNLYRQRFHRRKDRIRASMEPTRFEASSSASLWQMTPASLAALRARANAIGRGNPAQARE